MRSAMLVVCLLAGGCASLVETSGVVDPGAAATNGDELVRSVILFSSTRDEPSGDLNGATEIYRMSADGTGPQRLTTNAGSDLFPALSPDGKKILFDSNRLRSAPDPRNVSDLFIMNADGTGQVRLIRGSSGTWSPDGRSIAFHASASGDGQPISGYPGAATSDSDIFVMNLHDFTTRSTPPLNVTRNTASIDDDPDWSPDGDTIVFTSHSLSDNPTDATTAEIYVVRADGVEQPIRLTINGEEERAPSWSPDGRRIVYCCRIAGPDFEICVMSSDGSGQVRLTENSVADLTPAWSPDGDKIVFHRATQGPGTLELFVMNADGTEQIQLTDTPGQNAFPSWSVLPAVAAP